VWQRKERGINTGEGRCPLGLDEDDVKHVLLEAYKLENE
jgi:hypothetical protein